MAQRTQGRFGYQKVRLIKTELLGTGSYGAVYKALCDDLLCAGKILHPTLFQSNESGAMTAMRRFQQECSFLSAIRHPNIVQYLGSYQDPETRLPVLLMELMDYSLTQLLAQSQTTPTSFLDRCCLIPRPLLSHSQTTPSSFPDHCCLIPDHSHLIPRPLLSHSQATPTSFPDLCCLIPRPLLSHSQATPTSFPDHCCLIPRLLPPHSQTIAVSLPDHCCLTPRSHSLYSKTLFLLSFGCQGIECG